MGGTRADDFLFEGGIFHRQGVGKMPYPGLMLPLLAFKSQVATDAWVVGAGKVQPVESFEAYRRKELAKLLKTAV
jgi:hypothetical protein